MTLQSIILLLAILTRHDISRLLDPHQSTRRRGLPPDSAMGSRCCPDARPTRQCGAPQIPLETSAVLSADLMVRSSDIGASLYRSFVVVVETKRKYHTRLTS